jgi:hypothetical protein
MGMKSVKIVAAAASLALAMMASQAKALVDLDAFGGYTTLGMSDVNGAINAYATNNGAKATTITNGFYAGAAVGISVLPFLKIGPRLEYVQGGEGQVSLGSNTTKIDTALMSYELGLSADTSLPLTGLSLQGGIWGGYGMAGAELTSNQASGTLTATGSGFVANIGAQLRYKLVAGLFIGVDLGYRIANITNMNDTNTDLGGVVGQPLLTKAGTTTAANWDYSGVNAGGTIGWNF